MSAEPSGGPKLTCANCGEPIVSGERRCSDDRQAERSVVVHERCEPIEHVPRRDPDPQRLSTKYAIVFGEGVSGRVFVGTFGEWIEIIADITKAKTGQKIGDGELVQESSSTVLYFDGLGKVIDDDS